MVGETALWVNSLVLKSEDLSSETLYSHEKPGMAVHAYSATTEAETGKTPRLAIWPGWQIQQAPCERIPSKLQGTEWLRMTLNTDLWSAHKHAHVYWTHTYTHKHTHVHAGSLFTVLFMDCSLIIANLPSRPETFPFFMLRFYSLWHTNRHDQLTLMLLPGHTHRLILIMYFLLSP